MCMDAKGIVGTSLEIMGGILLSVGLDNDGEVWETRQLAYVAPGIQ